MNRARKLLSSDEARTSQEAIADIQKTINFINDSIAIAEKDEAEYKDQKRDDATKDIHKTILGLKDTRNGLISLIKMIDSGYVKGPARVSVPVPVHV